MRIWDLNPNKLCRNHLLGEHRELHAIWTVITKNKSGYSKHPETIRWKGKLAALYKRHDSLVKEIEKRGYMHQSPLKESLVKGARVQKDFIDSYQKQYWILKNKKCECFTN